MAPREVFDTDQQKQLRLYAQEQAARERARVSVYQEARRASWRQLVGHTITRIEEAGGDTLRITLNNETQFFVLPSEWATYTFDKDEVAYISEQEWKDVLA